MQRGMVLDIVDCIGLLLGLHHLTEIVGHGLPKLRVLQRQTIDSLDDNKVGLTGRSLVEAFDLVLLVDHVVL